MGWNEAGVRKEKKWAGGAHSTGRGWHTGLGSRINAALYGCHHALLFHKYTWIHETCASARTAVKSIGAFATGCLPANDGMVRHPVDGRHCETLTCPVPFAPALMTRKRPSAVKNCTGIVAVSLVASSVSSGTAPGALDA
eukprot:154763-Chlamydomonas_euryale.AAC.3